MKKIVIIAVFILLTINKFSVAQEEEKLEKKFEKLENLYMDEKYEDCIYKAEKYTYNDKTKRYPEPYLYLSMSYYEISLMDEPSIKEDYPKAFKNALKYAAKFRKKDKKNESYNQEQSYFNKLKKAAVEQAQNYYKDKNYRKASYTFKQIMKFDFDDYNVMFAKGVCDALSNNESQAEMSIDTSMTHLYKNYENPNYKSNKITEPVIIDAFILYSDYLNKKNKSDSAKATISIAKKFLASDSKIKKQYDKLFIPKTEVKDKKQEIKK
jgi:hypothetical protein